MTDSTAVVEDALKQLIKKHIGKFAVPENLLVSYNYQQYLDTIVGVYTPFSFILTPQFQLYWASQHCCSDEEKHSNNQFCFSKE